MMILVIRMSLKVLTVKQNAVEQDGYPIDFCSKAGGLWTNYFDLKKGRRIVAYGG